MGDALHRDEQLEPGQQGCRRFELPSRCVRPDSTIQHTTRSTSGGHLAVRGPWWVAATSRSGGDRGSGTRDRRSTCIERFSSRRSHLASPANWSARGRRPRPFRPLHRAIDERTAGGNSSDRPFPHGRPRCSERTSVRYRARPDRSRVDPPPREPRHPAGASTASAASMAISPCRRCLCSFSAARPGRSRVNHRRSHSDICPWSRCCSQRVHHTGRSLRG